MLTRDLVRFSLVGFSALFFCPKLLAQQPTGKGWKSQQIHQLFYAEASAASDINHDGHVDIVTGSNCFLGPDWTRSIQLRKSETFSTARYSHDFVTAVADINGDGWDDVLTVDFPGVPARRLLNPGAKGGLWEESQFTDSVDNESPHFVDLIKGGLPELVCGHNGQYGFYQAGSDPTEKWKWIAISRPGTCAGRFAHGLGVGDVNGDGLLDVLDKGFWWQQPADLSQGELWQQRRWVDRLDGRGGSQICVADVDLDGDADIVASTNAHGYGLNWYEQINAGEFVPHRIMGSTSTESPYGACFSQLHALAVCDVDNDGRQDIVTGKRWLAHGGKDPGGLGQPVLYWFRNQPSETDVVDFVPYPIDDDSGVGTDILVTDLNQDDKLDIVSCSKRGLTIHLQLDANQGMHLLRWDEDVARDQSKYETGLTPEQSVEKMHVPPGFSVDLIAAEPELTQPIAMCFDTRGRIWVVEGHTYPQKAPAGEGKDRIVIFSDEDADGSFETKKTFAEGINLASGIEVGFGGVYVGAAPELLFFPDADQDDVPDAKPTVLLDGWGYQDTHETLNSFTWGPDGWLYGCHGVFTHSRVGPPGTADAERIPINAGVWRFHPTSKKFEVFAHGTSNPWGVDFNERGDWFISACVIPHLYHIQKGGRYQRQAGQHFNRYTFDDIKTIADHKHYVGAIRDHAFWGENSRTRPPAKNDTSKLGGGHAHCGLAIYNGDVFPKAYRGLLFFNNLHGHRVVTDRVEPYASGYTGLHSADFALAQDHTMIGVGVMVGPDGAIYLSDWRDPQTCHNRDEEIWDRTNGRIYRIRYGDVKPFATDLNAMGGPDLISLLSGSNGFLARVAQRTLQERAAGFGGKDIDLPEVARLLRKQLRESTVQRDRLRMLWTLHCTGALASSDLVELVQDSDEVVRSWAVRLLLERPELKPAALNALEALAKNESSQVVRRELASGLAQLPLARRPLVASSLCKNSLDSIDPNIPFLVWYGIEPLADDSPDKLLDIALKSGWGQLIQFAARRLSSSKSGREELAARLSKPMPKANALTFLNEMLAVVKGEAGAKMPKSWPEVVGNLSNAGDKGIERLIGELSVVFGDKSAFPLLRERLNDRSAKVAVRKAALNALITSKDDEILPSLIKLLDEPEMAAVSATALASFNEEAIQTELLKRIATFDKQAQLAALSTLTSRKVFAQSLVNAMAKGELEANQVPAFIVRRIIEFDDAALTEQLESAWGRITKSSKEKKQDYEKYRKLLTTATTKPSAGKGRAVYVENCGKCHQLFGVGGEIGPDLTGANRTSVDYWLENILEPNALIGKAYQVTKVLTDDGRVINGVVKSENEKAITLQTATEVVVQSKDEVLRRELANVSLMPEGQLETLQPQQIRDLFAYLTSPNQVKQIDSIKSVPNAIVFEGEDLMQVSVSGGQARPQGMESFNGSWSQASQLWWTGGKVGDTLSFSVSPELEGEFEVRVVLTKAPDYGQFSVAAHTKTTGSKKGSPAEVDLFAQGVELAKPQSLGVIQVGKSSPINLSIEITGANSRAIKAYMFGLDRVELVPVGNQ